MVGVRAVGRWAVVLTAVAALAATPALAGALPVDDSDLTPEQLVAAVRGSDDVGWSGYGESRGRLVLPEADELGDLPGLFAGTTRVRAWWRGPQDWRVDALELTGEQDTARDADGTWTWDSADRRALRVVGDLPVRLPSAPDLLAPVLGQRLAGTSDVGLQPLPARRVAGRSADGVRLLPRDAERTTVDAVDLWVDPSTGLALQVEVRAGGEDEPVLTSLLLDLDPATPSAALTDFERPRRADVTVGDAPDVAAAVDRFAPYRLPDSLAGLPRRPRAPLTGDGGVATYGDGLTALAVLPLPRDVARRLVERIDDGDGRTARVSTPLVNAQVSRGRERAYLLVGTVPDSVLTAALVQLRADPPPRREGT